jgi:hypothetical protein
MESRRFRRREIGGGVPGTTHDIRLGDVVIRMPDGVYSGVAVREIHLGWAAPFGRIASWRSLCAIIPLRQRDITNHLAKVHLGAVEHLA